MSVHKSWSERIYDILKPAGFAGLRSLRVATENETQFGEVLTAARTPIIELNSSYGFSALRDLKTETGSGAVTDAAGSIDLSTGATASSVSQISSAEIGRYIPGYGAQIGVGVLAPETATGEQEGTWGGIGEEEDNGIYFGQDSDGIFVAVEKGGVRVVKVYQDEWNIDRLNGKGQSKYTLDVTEGVIFQIDFTWYGFGQILFGVIGIIEDDGVAQQHFIPCHSAKMTGVSLQTPNLRVFAKAINGATTSDYQLKIGGRQYSIIGNYVPKLRFCSEFRGSTATSTTTIPLVSFQRKEGFGDRSIKVEGFDAVVATEPVLIQVILDGTLDTAADFGTPRGHTATEQALEADYQATEISGGILIWQQLLGAGGNVNKGLLAASNVDFDIPNGQTVSFCARTVTGTGSIIFNGRCTEEW